MSLIIAFVMVVAIAGCAKNEKDSYEKNGTSEKETMAEPDNNVKIEDDDKKDTVTEDDIQSDTVMEDDTENDSISEDDNQSELNDQPIVFGLNETIELNGMKVTAKSVDVFEFAETYEGKDNIGILLEVENTSSNDTYTISTSLFAAGYADNMAMPRGVVGNVTLENHTGKKELNHTVHPGKKVEGYYIIEANEDWTVLELVINAGHYANNPHVTFRHER